MPLPGPRVAKTSSVHSPVLSRTDFVFVRRFVRERAAIVLADGKEYLVETRLKRLAGSREFDSIGALVAALRPGVDAALGDAVVNALTTNETSFFRDQRPFEVLRDRIIPEFIGRNGASRTLRMWCGAASTGQEPYSVLMLLRQCFPQLDDWDIDFVATDINGDVLHRARAGIYTQFEVNRGLPASLLTEHFDRDADTWRIKDHLRRRVRFEELNLVGPWRPFPKLDIVFLRNVLIYFDADVKRQILGKIREVLSPDGVLILGGAESTIDIDGRWVAERDGGATFYRPRPSERRSA